MNSTNTRVILVKSKIRASFREILHYGETGSKEGIYGSFKHLVQNWNGSLPGKLFMAITVTRVLDQIIGET